MKRIIIATVLILALVLGAFGLLSTPQRDLSTARAETVLRGIQVGDTLTIVTFANTPAYVVNGGDCIDTSIILFADGTQVWTYNMDGFERYVYFDTDVNGSFDQSVTLGQDSTWSTSTYNFGGRVVSQILDSYVDDCFLIDAVVTYTVTFQDWNGNVLKTETVEHGNAATAPANPTRSGYAFTGWSVTFSNVTSDLTVTAQYVQVFSVTFQDWDGTVLKTQSVNSGSAATAPDNPTRSGYAFTGWSVSFSNVTSDLTVTAQYVQPFTVTFVNWDQTVLKTQTVNPGSNATAPYPNPSRTGHTFSGWDVSFTNVTADITVMAQFTINKYWVTYKDWDYTVLKNEEVNYGGSSTPPADPVREEYTFLGWPSVTNVTMHRDIIAVYVFDAGIKVGDTLNEITINPTIWSIINTWPDETTLVTFTNGDYIVFNNHPDTTSWDLTLIGPDDLYVDITNSSDNPPLTSYDFDGRIVASLHTDLRYKISELFFFEGLPSFNVVFKNWNNVTLKTETVEQGSDAIPPTVPERTGYTFIGWDNYYTDIQNNITITALFEINVYIVTFLDYDESVIWTEEVEHGEALTYFPDEPERYEYTFIGWDNQTINAAFKANRFGDAPWAITESITTTAQYIEGFYYELEGDEDIGLVHFVQSPSVFVSSSFQYDTKQLAAFVDPAFATSHTIVLRNQGVDGPYDIRFLGHATITLAEGDTLEEFEWLFDSYDFGDDFKLVSYNTSADAHKVFMREILPVLTVQFNHPLVGIMHFATQQVVYGQAALDPLIYMAEEWGPEPFFKEWDQDFSYVRTDMIVNCILYEYYSVMFIILDPFEYHDTISVIGVISGEAVTPPEPPLLPGYRFSHWEVVGVIGDMDNVLLDFFVEAIYEPVYDYMTINIDRDLYSMTNYTPEFPIELLLESQFFIKIYKYDFVFTAQGRIKIDDYSIISGLLFGKDYRIHVVSFTIPMTDEMYFVLNYPELRKVAEFEIGCIVPDFGERIFSTTYLEWKIFQPHPTETTVFSAEYTVFSEIEELDLSENESPEDIDPDNPERPPEDSWLGKLIRDIGTKVSDLLGIDDSFPDLTNAAFGLLVLIIVLLFAYGYVKKKIFK